MRLFTVKERTDIEVKAPSSDRFITMKAQNNMSFGVEDIVVDPIGTLTTEESMAQLGKQGFYVFRVEDMDVKVSMLQVEVV